jgi:hypothetical protein
LEVARAFVFGALLGLDIEVNSVEPVGRMAPIKLHDRTNALQKLFPVFAGFIGVFARKQGFDSNVRPVKKSYEVNEAAFLRRVAIRGE